MVKVRVLAVDDRGKIKLSMRAVDQVTGEPWKWLPGRRAHLARVKVDRSDRGERRDGGFRRRRSGE